MTVKRDCRSRPGNKMESLGSTSGNAALGVPAAFVLDTNSYFDYVDWLWASERQEQTMLGMSDENCETP
jgi:hypothetical protein